MYDPERDYATGREVIGYVYDSDGGIIGTEYSDGSIEYTDG